MERARQSYSWMAPKTRMTLKTIDITSIPRSNSYSTVIKQFVNHSQDLYYSNVLHAQSHTHKHTHTCIYIYIYIYIYTKRRGGGDREGGERGGGGEREKERERV